MGYFPTKDFQQDILNGILQEEIDHDYNKTHVYDSGNKRSQIIILPYDPESLMNVSGSLQRLKCFGFLENIF